jgi:type II secretory ATPase GspE/PulE/Tfp pilus assembly ATPase PilB-like protein
MVSQRLVGRLCEACKKAEKPSPEVAELLEKEIGALQPFDATQGKKGPYEIWKAPGCGVCHNKGITGRVAIFEVFEMTRELGAVIAKDPSAGNVAGEALRQGMLTMRQDGLLKAVAGTISVEEVLRETSAS